MHICLVINSLQAGGAERVAVTLANEWTRKGHQVSLVTLAPAGLDFYALDDRVDRLGLHLMKPSHGVFDGIAANVHRLRRLREELRRIRPDVIVSFVDCMNVLVLIAAFGLRVPVVVSERTDPRMAPLGAIWETLRRLTYRRAAALVVQTRSVAKWARNLVDSQRVVVVPNPIIDSCFQVERKSCDGARVRRVGAVGRLSPEKGFDILIEAFERASTGHLDWSLVIAGEGPLAGALREQAGRTRCAGRIAFAGLVRKPEDMLAESEVFALSSRLEGFPNALVEAMACGCCVIAPDCASGPAEIITGGVDGVLVPVDNVDALAASLEALMANAAARGRLGAAAAKSAERFRADVIAEQWIRLLRSVSVGDTALSIPPADLPRLAQER